jgi:hypothetical protein
MSSCRTTTTVTGMTGRAGASDRKREEIIKAPQEKRVVLVGSAKRLARHATTVADAAGVVKDCAREYSGGVQSH